MRPRRLVLLYGLPWLLACATASPKAEVKPVAALPPPQVVKLREPLEVTPLELHFSGLRGAASVTESVAIKNTSDQPVQVSDLRIVGEHAATFSIVNVPLLPLVLAPSQAFSFSVGFQPLADAEVGVHHARIRVVRTEEDDGPPCDLSGLVSKSREPGDEPPLAQILDALGYDVDVGGTSLVLPAKSAGDQVAVPSFQRAKPGTVGFYLMARYSPADDAQFGYYVIESGKPAPRDIGRVSRENDHTLNPELESGSEGSFDLKDQAFGLYLKAGQRSFFTDARLNEGTAKRAARVYPLRSRGRAPVPDAFVIGYDVDGDGDFQDYVFMLWNVRPAS
jgi:hypothetical protein